MDNPLYHATLVIGGTTTTYNAPKVLGVRIHADQSFELQYTFTDSAAAAYDVSSATSALYVTAYKGSGYTPVLLVSGVTSDSGSGTTDRVTFTVPSDAIPEDIANFPLRNPGNAVFYAIITDGAGKKIEVVAEVNIFDTDYSLTGEAAPSDRVIIPKGNDLGTVENLTTTTPPTATLNIAYIVGASATGVWSGEDDNLAIGTGTDWVFLTPVAGNFVYDKANNIQYVFDTSWAGIGGAPFSDADALVKNDADATRLLTLSAASITTGTTRTATFPDADGTVLYNVIEDTTPQLGGFLDAADNRISSLLGLGAKAATTLTIATGAVTQTQLIHEIGNEAAAAADDLDSIVPATGQTELLLTMTASGQVPTIKHATGTNTFLLASDTDLAMVMNTFYHFHHDGTNWKLVGSSAAGGGGGSGNFPTSTDSGDKTTAYSVIAGDENTTIVAGSATSADFTITYDVSLWTTSGSLLTVANESTYIVKVVVSNTGTMTIGQGIDAFISPGGTITMAADTATHVRVVART